MANTKTRKPMSSKSKGLIGLVLLLALTMFVSCLAIGGMKLDKGGVNILLPWVPVTAENWPASLPRSRALGGGTYLEYTVEGEDADKAVEVFKARLDAFGATDFAVKLEDNIIRVELPEMDEETLKAVSILLDANGKFEFRTEDGNVFMTGEDIEQAGATPLDATYTNYALGLFTTDEGKQKLADATTEHANGSIAIYLDDGLLIDAGVGGQAFTTGQISVPLGMQRMDTMIVAIQMNCGSFEAKLTKSAEGVLSENGGNGARIWLIIAAVVLALALVVLIAKGKLSGVAAIWAVWCAVVLTMFLFAAVILAPSMYKAQSNMTEGCFIAVLAGIVLAAYVGYLRVVAIAKAAKESGSAKQAVKLGFRTTMKQVWMAIGAVLVLSIILMIIPATKIVGYTLAAGVFSAAVALPLMHLFLHCFTAITGKAALYGANK